MVIKIKLSSGSTKELEQPTEDLEIKEPPEELEIKEEVPDPPIITGEMIDNVESMTSVHEELDIKEDIKDEDPSELNCPLMHCPIMEGSLEQNVDLPIIAESPLHIPKKKPKRTLISTSKMKAYQAKKSDLKAKKKSLDKSKKKVIVPSLIKKKPQECVTPSLIKKKLKESVTSKTKLGTEKNIKVILGIKDKEKGQKSPIKPCIVSLRRLETEIISITNTKPRKTYMTPYGVAVTPCSIPIVPCDIDENVRWKNSKRFSHNKHSCDRCEKSFSQKSDLSKHIKSVHLIVQYNCDQCEKSFSRKGVLKEHIKSVHGNVRYNCDKCDKSFSSKGYLNHHFERVHMDRIEFYSMEIPPRNTIDHDYIALSSSQKRIKVKPISILKTPKPVQEPVKTPRKRVLFASTNGLNSDNDTIDDVDFLSKIGHKCTVCAKICQTEVALIDHKYYFHRIPRPGSDNGTSNDLSVYPNVEIVDEIPAPKSTSPVVTTIPSPNVTKITIGKMIESVDKSSVTVTPVTASITVTNDLDSNLVASMSVTNTSVTNSEPSVTGVRSTPINESEIFEDPSATKPVVTTIPTPTTSNEPLLLIPNGQTILWKSGEIPILVKKTTVQELSSENNPVGGDDEIAEVTPIEEPEQKIVRILKRKVPQENISRTPEPHQKEAKIDDKLDKKVSLLKNKPSVPIFPTDMKCTHCQKPPFKDYNELLQHMAFEHDIHFQLKCALCDFKAYLPKLLLKHREIAHKVSKPVKLQVTETEEDREKCLPEISNEFGDDKDEIGKETYFFNGKQVPGKRCIYCNKNTHPDHKIHFAHRMKCSKIKKQCQACFKVLNDSARTHPCFLKNKDVEFNDYIEEQTNTKEPLASQEKPERSEKEEILKEQANIDDHQLHFECNEEITEVTPNSDHKKPEKKQVSLLKRKTPILRRILPKPAALTTSECFLKNKNVECKDYIEDQSNEASQGVLFQSTFPTNKTCTKCKRHFNTYHHLLQHMASEHNIKFQFNCDLCDFKGNLPKAVRKHREEVHGISSSKVKSKTLLNPQFICNQCNFLCAASNKKLVAYHQSVCHKKAEASVSQVTESVTSNVTQSVTNPSYKLTPLKPTSEVYTTSPSQPISSLMEQNVQIVDESDKSFSEFLCKRCNQTFSSEKELESHELSVHFTKIIKSGQDCGKVKCSICSNISESKEGHFAHIQKEHKQMQESRLFRYESFLIMEKKLEKKLKEEEENLNKCSICQKLCITKTDLIDHQFYFHAIPRPSIDHMKTEVSPVSKVPQPKKKELTPNVSIVPPKKTLKEHKEALANRQDQDNLPEFDDDIIESVCAEKIIESKLDCDTCGKKCQTESELVDHKFYSHQIPRPTIPGMFKCKDCKLSFSKYVALQNHWKERHSVEVKTKKTSVLKFECYDCKITFSCYETLENHWKEKHSKHKPVTQASHPVTALAGFGHPPSNIHKQFAMLQKKHKPPLWSQVWECQQCNLTFSSQKRLEKHNEIHIKETKTVFMKKSDQSTSVLPNQSVNSDNQESNVTQVTQDEVIEEVEVPVINVEQVPDDALSMLVKDTILQPEEPVTVDLSGDNSVTDDTESKRCDYCDQLFPNQMVLENHVKNIHFPDTNTETVTILRFKCDFCDSRFNKEIDLNSHRLSHFKLKCDKCQHRFQDKKSLEIHVKEVHMFKCDKCKKYFDTQKLIDKHWCIAKGGRCATQCPDCEYVFKTKAELDRHLELTRDKK